MPANSIPRTSRSDLNGFPTSASCRAAWSEGNEMNDSVGRWKHDPVAFIEDLLRNPETRKPFEMYEAQQRFLQAALTPAADGRLPYPELLFSAPKKSGKTATAAMAT